MHMYLFRVIPFSFTFEAKLDAVDITIQKIVKIENEGCNADEDYNYIGKWYMRFRWDNLNIPIELHSKMQYNRL